MVEEGRVQSQKYNSKKVPRSLGPKDQNISKSHSNTSLTLKKIHLVGDCRVTLATENNTIILIFIHLSHGSKGSKYIKTSFEPLKLQVCLLQRFPQRLNDPSHIST